MNTNTEKQGWRRFKPVQLAYLAGLIDGDGCIGIERRDRSKAGGSFSFGISMAVYGNHAHMAALRAEAGIGNLWVCDRPGIKRICQWKIVGTEAREFLPALLPYLRLKKPQAECAIAIPKCKSRWHLTDAIRQKQEDHYLEMRHLNHVNGRGKLP